jgi:hypothetical protein
MNCEETILDLRDLEENIDGFRVEYEWNVGFCGDYLRFYGLRIEHRWTEWNMKGAHVV